MSRESKPRVWLYACSGSAHPAVLIAQMRDLVEEADWRGYRVAGASQDQKASWGWQYTGLNEMRRAVRAGRANAVLVKNLGSWALRIKPHCLSCDFCRITARFCSAQRAMCATNCISGAWNSRCAVGP